ncbi:MAG: short-chain-enoyl-CoA hydratase [Peptococcales bacterium]
MMYNNLIVEKQGVVGIIKINRPKALNSLNTDTLIELQSAFNEIELDEDIKVVILTGYGEKAFIAGADIAEMRDKNSIEACQFSRLGSYLFRRIELFKKPVIAAINGYALGGGCELAMCCDIRLASQKAKFGQPEVTLGIIPGFSGTQRLPRLIGLAKAKELIFTGEMIDAEEAKRLGLVNDVYAADQLLDKAVELANKIASKAQIAVSLAKAAINRGIETDIETGIAYEINAFGLCFTTKDQKEGMTAFLEKRKPCFESK